MIVKSIKAALRRSGEFIQLGCVAIAMTIVVFLLINLILDPFVPKSTDMRATRDKGPWSEAGAQAWLNRYGIDVLRRTYPGKSDEELHRILFRKVDAANHYEPFLEYLQDPVFYDGYGNHEAGFRFGGKEQGPWPIDNTKLNVFVFGSSTAYGAGSLDEGTISAFLQTTLSERLGRQVYAYNFGVGAFYSSQELINYWRLARDGVEPDLVVFVDGMNDYFQKTEDTAHSGFYRDFENVRVSFLRQLELDRGIGWHLAKAVQTSAIGRLASNLLKHETAPSRPGEEALGSGTVTVVRNFDERDQKHVLHATDRLINNFKMESGMASSLGTESAFVVQPDPMYAYDLSRHPFAVPDVHQYTKIGYPVLRERLKDEPTIPNVLWCADIQKDAQGGEALYSDPVHYTAAMHKLIATCIADGLQENGVLTRLGARKR